MGFFTRKTETWGRDAGPGPARASEPTAGTVVLVAAGSQPIAVIKALRELTGLGLREAKELTETPHAVVPVGVGSEAAAAAALRAAGATVTEPQTAGRGEDGDGDDLVGELERLAALHAAGALTDAEFTAAKARLLEG